MGGSKHALTDVNTYLPDFLRPYATSTLANFSNMAMPGGGSAVMPEGMNQQVAPFNPMQQQGIESMGSAAGNVQPLVDADVTQATDTLNGKYLSPDSNPYIKQTYDAAAKGLVDNYGTATAPATNAAALQVGAMGGSGFQQKQMMDRYGLGRNLGELGSSMYGDNYQQERGRQLYQQQMVPAALNSSFAPGEHLFDAGQLGQQQQQQELDVGTTNAMRGNEYPLGLIERMGNLMSTVRGPAQQVVERHPNRAGALK